MSRVLLALLVFITLTTSAFASEKTGYYASLSAGATFLNGINSDFTFLGTGGLPDVQIHTETDFKTGYNVQGAIGYDFGAIRLESEIRYAQNKIENIYDPVFTAVMVGGNITLVQTGTAKRTTKGESSSTSVMVNAFYDFENKTRFTPHVMLGLGASEVVYDDTYHEYDDKVFAYQLGTGISTAVTEKIALDFAYRYFATENPEFKYSGPGPLPPIKSSYKSHNISVGIRYLF